MHCYDFCVCIYILLQTLGDPNPFGLQTLVHQNVPSCDPLNNKGNSNSVENKSDQDIPRVLRRSSRLKGRDAKHIDDMYKMPEKILPKIFVCEDQTTNNSSTKNFRYATKLYLYLQVCYRPYG